jgi:hypothetical protein
MRMKAVVTGMIATYPVGGVVWDYGQYALGLERLGFEVYYIEDTGGATYDPLKGEYGEDCSYGVQFLHKSLAGLSAGLGKRWHFRNVDDRSYGLPALDVAEIVADADLFLNVSGGTLLRAEYMPNKRKVLIDTDPGWNHFRNYPRWDAVTGWHDISHGYRAHDHFFTYAENIGRPHCVLPSMGLNWRTTRPPVVLDCWHAQPPGKTWTTVMTWKNFPETIQYQGVAYGTKELEFEAIESLPASFHSPLQVAVGGNDAPIDHWRQIGWSVVDSQTISQTAESYRQYVESSRGEFSVAKNVYVATGSGWFSCRSVCYLAAGRPVVVQNTGFADFIPTGHGLFAFSSLDQAIDALDAVETDYLYHQQAAQELARTHFDSSLVLSKLLAQIGMD